MLQYISNLWNKLKLFVLNTIISKIHTLSKEDCVVIHREGEPDHIVGLPKFAGNSHQRRKARRSFIRKYVFECDVAGYESEGLLQVVGVDDFEAPTVESSIDLSHREDEFEW